MISRLFLFLAAPGWLVSTILAAAPSVLPVIPKAMPGYEITADCISPDGRYGVMHERREMWDKGAVKHPKNFLVALTPFKILCTLHDDAYIPGVNHAGDFDVQWTKDSSATLVVLGGNWGPKTLILVELRHGRAVRQTDLLPGLSTLMDAYFHKTSPQEYKASGGGFTILDDGSTWALGPKGVQATCAATTDLKQTGSGWNGAINAFWSIGQRKWGNATP